MSQWKLPLLQKLLQSVMLTIILTNQYQKTGLNLIWLLLREIPRNPITTENTGNNKNNTLPTPIDFDLDGCKTPNTSNMVIIKEEEVKKPTTISSEILQYH